jgi:hypothetical protein
MASTESNSSGKSSKPARPQYEVKIAKTRDEVEACFDIRVESEFKSKSAG